MYQWMFILRQQKHYDYLTSYSKVSFISTIQDYIVTKKYEPPSDIASPPRKHLDSSPISINDFFLFEHWIKIQ